MIGAVIKMSFTSCRKYDSQFGNLIYRSMDANCHVVICCKTATYIKLCVYMYKKILQLQISWRTYPPPPLRLFEQFS